MKVVKSISLNEDTAPLAAAKVNFSAWVRKALLDEAALSRRKHPDGGNDHHIAMRPSMGVCWPFHAKGCCHLCWPDGPPTEEGWRTLMAETRVRQESHRPDLVEVPTLPEGQGWLSDEEEAALLASKEENGPSTPPLRRRYVRRFLAWAWEWI